MSDTALIKRRRHTANILEYTRELASKRMNSKAYEMLTTVYNNYHTWDTAKQNRWIGYAQCLLVAEGAITLDELRTEIEGIIQ